MASRRQLDFHRVLKVKSTYVPKQPSPDLKPKYKSPHTQLDIFGAIKKAKKKLASAERSAKRKQRQKTTRQNREARRVKAKRDNPYRTDGRVSVLPANSTSVKQPRLNQAGVPNAIAQFPAQFNLEAGNFKSGSGTYQRTFAASAEFSAKVQAAAAKNVLKRAKRIKRISARTVAVASVGSIIAAGVNRKMTANKVPEGYKMVFGKLRKIK